MTLNKEPITINITTIVRFCSSQNANRAYLAATETSGSVSEESKDFKNFNYI